MRRLVADMAAADMAAGATGAAVPGMGAAVVAHMGAAAAGATLAVRVTARLRGAKVRAPLALRPRQPMPASQFLQSPFMAARCWSASATQSRLAHGAYRLELLFSVAGIRIVF